MVIPACPLLGGTPFVQKQATPPLRVTMLPHSLQALQTKT